MATQDKQRIDKWLFFARAAKSRSVAAKLAVAGHVRVNKTIEQASHQVRVGDVLTISSPRRILVYRILALGARRGPAAEARLLYEDLSPPPVPSDRAGQPAAREVGSGRPTKRERRQVDRLRRDS